MKKLLLATTAVVALAATSAGAADLRPAYRPAPPQPVYTWTGPYFGVNVGYSWGQSKHESTLLGIGTFSHDRDIDGVSARWPNTRNPPAWPIRIMSGAIEARCEAQVSSERVVGVGQTARPLGHPPEGVVF